MIFCKNPNLQSCHLSAFIHRAKLGRCVVFATVSVNYSAQPLLYTYKKNNPECTIRVIFLTVEDKNLFIPKHTCVQVVLAAYTRYSGFIVSRIY